MISIKGQPARFLYTEIKAERNTALDTCNPAPADAKIRTNGLAGRKIKGNDTVLVGADFYRFACTILILSEFYKKGIILSFLFREPLIKGIMQICGNAGKRIGGDTDQTYSEVERILL